MINLIHTLIEWIKKVVDLRTVVIAEQGDIFSTPLQFGALWERLVELRLKNDYENYIDPEKFLLTMA